MVVTLWNAKHNGMIAIGQQSAPAATNDDDQFGPSGIAVLVTAGSGGNGTEFEWSTALVNDCPDATTTGFCAKDMGDAWGKTSSAV
jgi:hypothetical protein